MGKRVSWVRIALVGLLLAPVAPLVFGQRPAGIDSNARMKLLGLAQLQALLQQKLLAKQALQAQITRQESIRDRYQTLADQPYTLCPHKCPYPICTHTQLKARYDRQKQQNLAQVRRAEAQLRVLRTSLQQVEADIEALKRRLAALTGGTPQMNGGLQRGAAVRR
jgi:hypothetical protein